MTEEGTSAFMFNSGLVSVSKAGRESEARRWLHLEEEVKFKPDSATGGVILVAAGEERGVCALPVLLEQQGHRV